MKSNDVLDNTPAQELRIKMQIKGDPDTWEAPIDAKPRRRGRPLGQSKSQVTMRLDKDVLSSLKSEGAGWQTRANALLRKALAL